MERKDGGPAFPTTFKSITGYHLEHKECAFTSGSAVAEYEDVVMPGMTLRDYFAGQALSAMLSNSDTIKSLVELIGNKISPDEALAEASYNAADAMLKERKK